MKILLLSNMYPSEKSPAFGTFVKVSNDALEEAGFTIERVVIDEKPLKKHQKITTYFSFYLRALKALLFNQYDYVYAHYVSHVSLPLVFAHYLGKKLRVIAHVHGGDVKQLSGTSSVFFKIKQFLSSKIMRLAEKVVSPSKSYAQFVSDVYSLPLDKFAIYPSGGVNQKRFYLHNAVERRDVLGYAGRLIPSKNVDLIIQAMQQNTFTLEIVGTGSEEERLKALVETLGLSDRVSFHKPKSHDGLADWFRSIDCLLYPSASESLGLVPLEAMACGADVVLSDIPAFRELKSAGLNVNLLPELSPLAISTMLEAKSASPITTAQREQSAKDILENYGSDNVKAQLLALFSKPQ